MAARRIPFRWFHLMNKSLPLWLQAQESNRTLALAAAVLTLLLLATSGHAASPPRNVVLIVADDLGAHDLGVTGSRFHETPNLDRLAANGMRFTQAYAACTVCSPSRAALLTGRYPARLQLTDWIAGHESPRAKLRPPVWNQRLAPAEVTLAEALKERGFATAHLGKWHLGAEGYGPEQQGFEINLGGDQRGQPPSYFSPYGLPKLPDGPPGEYLTDREGEEAARFVRQHKDRPFFLNYWAYSVHTPLQAPAELVAKYRVKASQVGGPQTNATYAAMLERLDASVGRILRALQEHGLAENTLVIFTSDNGGLVAGNTPPTSNAPLRSGKGSPYEGGHRVPLIVSWPGVTRPGSTSDQPVAGIDLLPTVLEAVGASPSAPVTKPDGLSLVPLIHDPTAKLNREALFWHYPHYHPGGATPYAALRTGDWKLIQYYESGRHELFDVRADPGESHDLATAQPERVMELARKLSTWQGGVGAQWPMPNPAWDAPLLSVATEGPIRLHSREAFVHSEVLRYEPQPFKDTLGWWVKPEDWAEWHFASPRTGRFTLEILHGCGNGSGGSEVEFALDAKKFLFTVVETGGFQSFTNKTLGDIELTPGPHNLTVRPRKKPGAAVMDLREVVLRPISSTP